MDTPPPRPQFRASTMADSAISREDVVHPDTPVRSNIAASRMRLMGDDQPSPGPYVVHPAGTDHLDEKHAPSWDPPPPDRPYAHHDQQQYPSEYGSSALDLPDDEMIRRLEKSGHVAEQGLGRKLEQVDAVPVTGSRRRWLAFVWLLTWWLPSFAIGRLGRTNRQQRRRPDVRLAWREKLAINLLIWLACLSLCFFIVLFPELLCPKQDVFSAEELSAYDGKAGHGAYVSVRGIVFDLAAFAPTHYPSIVPTKNVLRYAGLDATDLFPVQVSALCEGIDGEIDPATLLDYKPANVSGSASVISLTDQNARYHDFRYYTADYRPDWFYFKMKDMRSAFMVGRLGYSPDYISILAGKQRSIASINGRVYDMTRYLQQGATVAEPKGQNASGPAQGFMATEVENLFQTRAGQDISGQWAKLTLSSPALKPQMKLCLDNLFYVGDVDTRNSGRCLFARYILLAVSILLCTVIGFKFFAALQFGGATTPEERLDRFIICQVPAYSEDEDSLRRAIDSIARMKYDDKRKLLVVICDGMVTGAGNDRPTPRIVLDILGVPHTDPDPVPLDFESLGEGMHQHNMGQIYSGLYEVQGHIVPFLVIVKVGRPSERVKPGNRGKRDSQVILMRFLQRLHYDLPLNPLELEMQHQIRNVIGVNPAFYEFLFQVDADTAVGQDSATRLISACLADTRIIGICGETALTNARSSFITMIQVYEYYISHNLSKAFESLFGSVTCLPGCFTMYRIRAADSDRPLFVSTEVVEAYSTIRVDTLHMKNLLHLGEDRYLTTLLLRHHPKYKTKYTFHAHAWTIAPEGWKVFLSQRRRWINSTVHNLFELLPMGQLCGFCCFGMRFVVFLDLLSTIVQPVTVAYIAYLVVLLIRQSNVVPLTAFILLGAIYGLQAIIFILRRKWEMIGWMILYILAIPIFSFALPLYAFWSMDDFSWGSTRVIQGDNGRAVVVSDMGRFDPDSIPRKRWEDHQAELWEAQTNGTLAHENQSVYSGYSYSGHKGHGHQRLQSLARYSPHSRWGSDWSGSVIHHGQSMSASHPDLPMGRGLITDYSPRDSRTSLVQPELRSPSRQHVPRALWEPRSSLTAIPPPQYGSSYPCSSTNGPTSSVGGEDPFSESQMEDRHRAQEVASQSLPSEVAILAEIRDILSNADLMGVTKRSVRLELERRFGVSLEARRSWVGQAIESVLSGSI